MQQSIDVCWYVVGYGGDELLIRKAIAETGMEKHFVLVGKQINPYPYIKACDIYVQPSRYEGKAVTVREAQILGKSVAITVSQPLPANWKKEWTALSSQTMRKERQKDWHSSLPTNNNKKPSRNNYESAIMGTKKKSIKFIQQ